MKSEWEKCTLRNLVSFISKGIAPKYSDIETENTIRVLNQKCNRNYNISYAESRFHDLSKKKVPSERYVKPYDIIINATGTGTAGRIAQIYSVPCPTIIDGHMIIIRANKKISQKYLGYALKAHQVAILKLDEGSTGQTELNRERLLDEILICYPNSIALQEKISSILRNIDDKIELNTRINENLEQQAQAIFKSWFVDFEPFGGVMPEDWRMGKIEDLSDDIVCGKTPSTKVKEYYGDDIPFITIPDMHNTVYTLITERKLSSIGANSQSKKSLPKNSICVSCIGTAGLVTLVPTISQTNQQINSIIPKHEHSPYYIYLLMKTLSETINKLGQSGSTIVNLNKAQFAKIEVMIPSISVMKKFDNIVNPIFQGILHNQFENQRLSALRDTLLPKLMSGEIDVSEVKV